MKFSGIFSLGFAAKLCVSVVFGGGACAPTLGLLVSTGSILHCTVRHQSFWFQWPRNLSEYLAVLVCDDGLRVSDTAGAGDRFVVA